MKRVFKGMVNVIFAVTLCAGVIVALESIRQAGYKISQEIQKTTSIR